ncbi:hypothetical protein FRC12_021438, partial [Ceratobasidium sp. 428]
SRGSPSTPSTLGRPPLGLPPPLWTTRGYPSSTQKGQFNSSRNLLVLGSMDAPPDEGKPRPVRTRI